jgi:hypothetical protein
VNENNPFKILNEDANAVAEITADSISGETAERIKTIIGSDTSCSFYER